MGAFCCCPCGDDFEEYTHSSYPMHRHCMCLRYFLHHLFYGGYAQPFHRIDGRTPTSAAHMAAPVSSTTIAPSADNSSPGSPHLIPRPPPFESGSRYSRLQRDGLISRREKAITSHAQDNQHLRRNASSADAEQLACGKKRKNANNEEELPKVSSLGELEINLPIKGYSAGYVLEDEDFCPTCLEEYNTENPKIKAKCSHHFHLSCIYEWMERSDSCPICGKEMEFCESL